MESKTELLMKLKALAERGVGGEKESAARLLEKLMRKYGVTDQDLGAEATECYWFRYREKLDRRLLNQVIYMAMGNCNTYKRGRFKEIGLYCTAAQRLEIEVAFEFFNRAMQDELKTFYRAFINKNSLFPPKGKERPSTPDDEIDAEERYKIAQMMEGMERHSMKKMLLDGSGGNAHE